MSRTLADVTLIRANFTRSVNIERDAQRWLPNQSDYVLTALARQITRQVVDSLQSPRGTRAWTITGPYGTGKSAFALALVQLLRGGGPAPALFADLQSQDPHLAAAVQQLHKSGHYLLPVLISGRRDSLVPALHAGLLAAVESAVQQAPSERGSKLCEDIRATDCNDAVKVCALFQESSKLWNGLIVVIDELGKFLEYVAQRPDRGDIFALQMLAEAAARSANPPFLLFTILHQAFTRYSTHLTQAQREEFGKVQGRFVDVAFNHTYDQVVRLIGAAVQVDRDTQAIVHCCASRVVDRAEKLGVKLGFGDSLGEALVSCAPLHPVTALILGPLFRQLAQNERSLFGFLAASEAHGLQDFMSRTEIGTDEVALYTPDHLYDYVSSSLGTALYHEGTGRRWALVQATLDRMRHINPLETRIIKTVGLMAAVGEISDLRATPEMIALALDLPMDETKTALERLVRKSALVYRSFVQAYHLWDGSDIDIESRLVDAQGYVDEAQSLDELLTRLLPPRPVIARRYSFATGTLRFFETVYASPHRLEQVLRSSPKDGDGLVVFTLVESAGQNKSVSATGLHAQAILGGTVVLVPIHVPSALRGAALELQRLKWVLDNTPQLSSDTVALTELRARIYETEQILLREVEHALNPANGDIECYYRGVRRTVTGWRGLNQLVSEACQQLYPSTPAMSNELINRRALSSAATAARRLLLERMLEKSELPNLGIERHPPELSMYLSLLKNTGLHREINGVWRFTKPAEGTPLIAIWEVWEEFLESSRHERRSIKELWDRLASPPYGLLDGIIPVLILAMVLERSLEVGLYESGTFIPTLTLPKIERLLKTADKFEVRFCPLDGVRREVFDELGAIGLPTERGHLIPVVRQLCTMADRLPEYSKKTKSVSPEAQKVRMALLSAREPDVLIFEQLPEALGLPSMLDDGPSAAPREYARRLADALQELQMAHTRLHDHLFQLVAEQLDLPQNDSSLARRELQSRCTLLRDMVVDLRMKSFVRHCSNEWQDFSAWVESIGSFLANRAPSTWTDDDMSKFQTELNQMARKFNNLLQLAVEAGQVTPKEGVDAVRLGLTAVDGSEQQKVIFLRPETRTTVDQAVNDIMDLLQVKGTDSEARLVILALLAKAWLPTPEETA